MLLLSQRFLTSNPTPVTVTCFLFFSSGIDNILLNYLQYFGKRARTCAQIRPSTHRLTHNSEKGNGIAEKFFGWILIVTQLLSQRMLSDIHLELPYTKLRDPVSFFNTLTPHTQGDSTCGAKYDKIRVEWKNSADTTKYDRNASQRTFDANKKYLDIGCTHDLALIQMFYF